MLTQTYEFGAETHLDGGVMSALIFCQPSFDKQNITKSSMFRVQNEFSSFSNNTCTQQLQPCISLIPGPTQSFVLRFALIHGSRKMAGKVRKHSSHEVDLYGQPLKET